CDGGRARRRRSLALGGASRGEGRQPPYSNEIWIRRTMGEVPRRPRRQLNPSDRSRRERASRGRSHVAGSCVAACAGAEASRRGNRGRNWTGGMHPPGAERAPAPLARGHEAAERDERGGFAGHVGGEHAATPQAPAHPRQLLHHPAVTVEKLTPISAANVSWLMPRRRRRPRTLPALSFIVTPPPTWERAAATPSAPLLAP